MEKTKKRKQFCPNSWTWLAEVLNDVDGRDLTLTVCVCGHKATAPSAISQQSQEGKLNGINISQISTPWNFEPKQTATARLSSQWLVIEELLEMARWEFLEEHIVIYIERFMCVFLLVILFYFLHENGCHFRCDDETQVGGSFQKNVVI